MSSFSLGLLFSINPSLVSRIVFGKNAITLNVFSSSGNSELSPSNDSIKFTL